MPNYGPIEYDINLDAPGKRVSTLRLVHSDNTNAYSIIPIPIAVIVNGNGPTVLLAAGNHGNEYEGLSNSSRVGARAIDGRRTRAADRFAVPKHAGRTRRYVGFSFGQRQFESCVSRYANRWSNRSDSRLSGRTLLPLCDAGIDIHTGGNMGTFVPLVFLCECKDRDVFKRSAELAAAFAAPWTYLVTGVADQGGFDPCAQNQGVAFISTELGGGWRLGGETLDIGRRGVRNMLAHLGVIQSTETQAVRPGQLRYVSDSGPNGTLVSSAAGFLETHFEPSSSIKAGDTVATIHPIENGFEPPTLLSAPREGVIVSQRTTAHIRHGDIVMNVATEIERSQITAGGG